MLIIVLIWTAAVEVSYEVMSEVWPERNLEFSSNCAVVVYLPPYLDVPLEGHRFAR